jgi:hypothetical protein
VQQLPESALVTILRHVPQRERLASCALVSTAWAGAAAAASAHVLLQAGGAAHKVAALQAWLHQHAHHVASLDVSAIDRPSLRLPTAALARLQRLEVSHIQPIPSLQGSSHLPLLPALRSVILEGCSMTAASLELLAQQQLTALELDSVTVAPEAGKSRHERQHGQQQAVTALLQAQPQLSRLRTHDMQLTDAALAPLGAMQQLRELSISDSSGGMSLHRVLGLHSHLTSLELLRHGGARPAASPPTQLPPCLVCLSLCGLQLEPAALSGLTQLEQLQLSSCSLLAPAALRVSVAQPAACRLVLAHIVDDW